MTNFWLEQIQQDREQTESFKEVASPEQLEFARDLVALELARFAMYQEILTLSDSEQPTPDLM